MADKEKAPFKKQKPFAGKTVCVNVRLLTPEERARDRARLDRDFDEALNACIERWLPFDYAPEKKPSRKSAQVDLDAYNRREESRQATQAARDLIEGIVRRFGAARLQYLVVVDGPKTQEALLALSKSKKKIADQELRGAGAPLWIGKRLFRLCWPQQILPDRALPFPLAIFPKLAVVPAQSPISGTPCLPLARGGVKFPDLVGELRALSDESFGDEGALVQLRRTLFPQEPSRIQGLSFQRPFSLGKNN